MFSRYRRGSAGGQSKLQSNANGGAHQASGNRFGSGNFPADSAEAIANLEELRVALNRLEELTGKVAPKSEAEGEDAAAPGAAEAAPNNKGKGEKADEEGSAAPSSAAEDETATAADGTAVDSDDGGAVAKESEVDGKDNEVGDGDEEATAKEAGPEAAETQTGEAKEGETSASTSDSKDDDEEEPARRVSPTKYERSPSASASDLRALADAAFLDVEEEDQAEMVELIRRIAELVVLSERRAGQILAELQSKREEAAAERAAAAADAHSEKSGQSTGEGEESGGSHQSEGESTDEASSPSKEKKREEDKSAEDEKKVQEERRRREEEMYSEDIALPYLALFELFCERNALAKIVNIVTGVAFLREDEPASKNDDSKEGESSSKEKQQPQQSLLLPPLPIATQAVQSVSILIQNVSRATSLYFLLSNNRVNDLIKLPLHLYKRAEINALHEARYNKAKNKSPKKGRRGRNREKLPPLPPNLLNYQSPEMGELTTHFVSFLKSLAMRVNSETLQFFLSFPLNEGGIDETKPRKATDGMSRLDTYLERRRVVEFPLYARALEFCSSEGDSFVRVTAMNVCMNLIRLVTVHDDFDDDDDQSSDDDSDVDESIGGEGDDADAEEEQKKAERQWKEQQRQSSLPTSTPSGILHTAPPALPLQDRIAIAQYACHPRRVSDLVSPLCARLTSQFGLVEGTVRAIEELNDIEAAVSKMDAATALTMSPKKGKKGQQQTPQSQSKQSSSTEKERTRLRNTVQNLIANVQDELLLLDDLLKVGLLSLNEQAIEMMLATFVYPMLLQPLLLPLTRFGSGKRNDDTDGETKDGEKRRRKPVINLQTPRPFSDDDENDESTTANGEGYEPTSNGPSKPKRRPQQREYCSSADMDLAPSKTALFGLSVIFHTISNPTLRSLLFVALLHPLSPEASGGAVIEAPPHITLPCKRKDGVCSSDDFQIEIRSEGNQAKLGKDGEGFRGVDVYTFGTDSSASDGGGGSDGKGGGASDGDDVMSNCVFILAPALVDMLRNHTGGEDKQRQSPTQSEAATTRSNPYRGVLLNSISGMGEMVSLQRLATAALHAAVSSVDDGSVLRKILFRSTTMDSPEEYGNVRATLGQLCRGILNTFVTYDGWFKVKFNTVAARTLMDVASDDPNYISLVADLVGDVRLKSAEYLLTLPYHLDSKSRGSGADAGKATPNNADGNREPADGSRQHIDHWLLDRFFFDQADKSTNSVVENVCYLKEQAVGAVGDDGEDGKEEAKEQYRYGLEVLGKVSISGTSELLCEDDRCRVVDGMVVDAAARGNTPFHCAASWALACLYLDAFCVKLSKMGNVEAVGTPASPRGKSSSSIPERELSTSSIPQRKLSYISASKFEDDDDSDDAGFSLAHISSKFAIAMLDEGESDKKTPVPTHGSAVGLVGKAAFPCVCEVSSVFADLFTGRTCISNEGIQWQSLYLVVVGKWAVLAEPGHGGTGGEGRVITACRLACLAVKKDNSSQVNNKTPARRLLVAHASLDPRPPSLFLVDKTAKRSSGPSLGPDGLRLTRSRMDLWFEDANAAGHACKVLSAKIAKARARRGGRIRSALLAT